MKAAKIIGTGMKVPKYCLTNDELSKLVDTSDEWIRTRTGIRTRYICKEENETCVSLSTEAARQALEGAGLKATDVDLIIFATITPNRMMPSAACELGNALGAPRTPGFDVTAACSGFVYSLSIAKQFIQTETYKNILCIGAEVLSSVVNWKDRSTCVLFGDGAGAAVVSATEEDNSSRILSTHIYAESIHGDLLCIPASGSKIPPRHEKFHLDLAAVAMQGRELYKYAVTGMTQAGKDALEHNNMSAEDVDLVIPHQANIRIIEAVGKRLKIPEERTMINVDKYGNTSAATIPMALHEAIEQKRCKKGDLVLLASFGGV